MKLLNIVSFLNLNFSKIELNNLSTAVATTKEKPTLYTCSCLMNSMKLLITKMCYFFFRDPSFMGHNSVCIFHG